MYKGKSFAAIVPARAGSKGVRGKNRRLCAGKPLVSWTFEAARACPLLDGVYCSTDDPAVARCAGRYGVEVLPRPKRLATDQAKMLGVILDVKQRLEKSGRKFDYLVLLQPTSPLRTANDISRAVKQIIRDNTASLASVSLVDLRAGLLVLGKKKNGALLTRSLAADCADVPRQQKPLLFRVDGAVYVWRNSFLTPHCVLNAPQSAVVLPKNHARDIDTPADFKACEELLNAQVHSGK